MGINSNRSRAAALAFRSRGYHVRGVAIFRPSAKVTTSSSAVKPTETGLISSTSISKVLMPFAFEDIPLRSQVAHNSADFPGRKSRIHCHRQVMEPEFRFETAGPNVNMRGFAAFIGIEKSAIWSPAQNSRHSILFIRRLDKLRSRPLWERFNSSNFARASFQR